MSLPDSDTVILSFCLALLNKHYLCIWFVLGDWCLGVVCGMWSRGEHPAVCGSLHKALGPTSHGLKPLKS